MTSIIDPSSGPGEKEKPRKKGKELKRPFYLNPEDGEKFEYRDLCLISEIKDELNRITSAENVKHIFGTDIFRYLTEAGCVEEKLVEGRMTQMQTELGTSLGIVPTEKISFEWIMPVFSEYIFSRERLTFIHSCFRLDPDQKLALMELILDRLVRNYRRKEDYRELYSILAYCKDTDPDLYRDLLKENHLSGWRRQLSDDDVR